MSSHFFNNSLHRLRKYTISLKDSYEIIFACVVSEEDKLSL